MSRDPIVRLESPTVILPWQNIDTDQIIPARFLQAPTREDVAAGLFADWRSRRPDFPLNDARAAEAAILVAADNFGCGSSREHAAWALAGAGFRAVVSPRLADIFRANAVKNGIVPVEVDQGFAEHLLDRPWGTLRIDLEALTVEAGDGRSTTFHLDAFARHCLMEGIDELEFLLEADSQIAAFEAAARNHGGNP